MAPSVKMYCRGPVLLHVADWTEQHRKGRVLMSLCLRSPCDNGEAEAQHAPTVCRACAMLWVLPLSTTTTDCELTNTQGYLPGLVAVITRPASSTARRRHRQLPPGPDAASTYPSVGLGTQHEPRDAAAAAASVAADADAANDAATPDAASSLENVCDPQREDKDMTPLSRSQREAECSKRCTVPATGCQPRHMTYVRVRCPRI